MYKAEDKKVFESQQVKHSRVPPHKKSRGVELRGLRREPRSMSQSNDFPETCADKGGRGEATSSLGDALRSGARPQQKKRHLATVTIVDPPTGKKKKTSWVWKVMQQFSPPIGKCSVRCTVQVSKRGL